MEEGDLFGVRAIQSGFYGGVAQSAPSSPVGSRAPSLYNQPTSTSGPLNSSSPYIPLMHPQASGSTLSLQHPRSPFGLNPMRGDGQAQIQSGPPSPIPNAMLRDSQRPGTSGSNRGFERPTFPNSRDSAQSARTINLDGLAPVRRQEAHTSLKPSASDASTDGPSSTNKGTIHGSGSSSFTSTYSFEDGAEQTPRNPKIVKPFEGLPTLPVLQPLSAEVHDAGSRKPAPAPMQRDISSTSQGNIMTEELPADLQRSPPKETNFSTPFRRLTQPEHMNPPPSPGFGPLPAGAMNGGPQQFGYSSRTQSPGPLPMKGTGDRNQSISSGPRNQIPPRQHPPPRSSNSPGSENEPIDSSQRRVAPPTSLQFAPHRNRQPSLPAFLQTEDGFQSTELEMPRYPGGNNSSNEPRSAPPTKTNSSSLLPKLPQKNRLTADILGDFYDSYSYTREEQENIARQKQQQQQQQQRRWDDNQSQYQTQNRYQPPNQQFEMHRMPGPSASAPGSPRRLQAPMDKRMI